MSSTQMCHGCSSSSMVDGGGGSTSNHSHHHSHHHHHHHHHHHQSNHSTSSFDLEGLEESLVDNLNDDDEEEDDFIMMDTPMLIGGSNEMNESTSNPATLPVNGGNVGPSGSGSYSPGIIFDHNLYLIREALIRDSNSRSEDDIEIIVRFLSIINSNHDHMTRRRLAPHFVLAEIEARDTRVLTHGEKLDAYCIVAAGSLRHVLPCDEDSAFTLQETSVDDDISLDTAPPTYIPQIPDSNASSSSSSLHHHSNHHHMHHHHHDNVRYLHVGDEFGAHLDDRIVYGEIYTNEDFVWVLCVPHIIFDQICGEKTFKTIRDEITGDIIEMRANCLLPPAPPPSSQPPLNQSSKNVDQQQQLMDDINSLASTNLSASNPSLQSGDVLIVKSNDFISASTQSTQPPSATKNLAEERGETTTSNELIRATKERLYDLVLTSNPNETFIEDFLLTFRIWSEKDLHPSNDVKIMTNLMQRICHCIRSNMHTDLVENCVRIVLIWLVNHFQDFHNNDNLLDEFELALKENPIYKPQLRLFYMHLSAKSLERQVTVTRSDRNAPLMFSLIGGYECSARLFIGEILTNTTIQSPSQTSSNPMTQPPLSSHINLRPGDRIISINGVDCHVMPIARAYELCRSSTHLSLQVKYDPHLFYALIEGRHETKRQIVETFPLTNRLSTSTTSSSSSTTSLTSSSGFSSSNSSPSISSINSNNGNGHNVLSPTTATTTTKDGKKEGWKLKVRSLVSSTTNMLHSNNNNNTGGQIMSNSNSTTANSLSSGGLNGNGNVASHPRILSYEIPEIIKIYSFEYHNDCCFLPIHSSTTVRECIQLALRQLNKYPSNFSSRDFALYEYSVIFTNNGNSSNTVNNDENIALQNSSTVVKRLNDGTNDLVANLGLNSRLYLKLISSPTSTKDLGNESISDAEIAKEIIKDSSINSLLTLKSYAIARELTARDFRLFCKIESQQFVYDLAFNDPNSSKNSAEESVIINERTKDLQEFERKTNEEMFWTINQVLGEKRSITKRVKAIKQLIRIATVAMKLNNYNTLFAILSGLMHLSVSRLKSCWDKVPAKHLKQLQKLQQLMDPSRNFYNFRQQLMQKLREDDGSGNGAAASIIIPFFPLVKKDLSFIWLANQTYVTSKDSNSDEMQLVNWEKMRLLSEKIREIQKMANTTSLALAAINGLNQGSNNSSSTAMNSLAQSTIATNEPIDPNLLFRIFADQLSSENNKSSSSDHKKLWENQRMTKRVQSFLDESFASISSDEHELLSRSYSCELPQTPNSSSSTHVATTRSSIASTMSSNSQLSHPSPTPSSASSSSNSLSMNSDGTPNNHNALLYRPQRPKFGQTSPKQLRKLLALSDGSVIVPHSGSGSGGQSGGNTNSSSNSGGHNHHHHHQNSVPVISSTNNSSQSHHVNAHHHHQTSVYGMNQRVSTSHHQQFHSSSNLTDNCGGSSSTLSSTTSSTYYYGSGGGNVPHSNHYSSTTLMNVHHGNSAATNYHPKSMGMTPYTNSGGVCCSTAGSNTPLPLPPPMPCCGNSSSLYPNQLYCPCCTPLMLPSMIMMMPPPQTSGLMHPSCPCMSNNNNNNSSRSSGRGRQSNSLPPKQSLPVESSSVTSLRRLEQFQMSRGSSRSGGNSSNVSSNKQTSRAGRPQCPDYDTTMQRISGAGGSLVTINGSLVGPNGPPTSQNNSSAAAAAKPTIATVKHHRQASHHREDIV